MINIISMDRLFPESKVMECINLLGAEYTSLDFTVEIHTKYSLTAEYGKMGRELSHEEFESVMSPKVGEIVPKGMYLPDYKKIKMFPFTVLKREYREKFPDGSKFKYQDLVRYMIIQTLYHEIRHVFQHSNDPNVFNDQQEVKDLTKDFNIYQNLSTEIDADNFEREQSLKYGMNIREIFGVRSTLFPTFPKYGTM